MVIKLQKKSIEDLNKKVKDDKSMIAKKEVKEEKKKVEATKPEIKT